MRLVLTSCEVDLDRGVVLRDGAEERLTTKEAHLLEFLARNPQREISRAELLTEVWGYSARSRTRTIDNTVRRLRSKIEAVPSEPDHVLTVFGEGYRYEPHPSERQEFAPSGEVTLVSCQISGAGPLWRRDPETMAVAQELYDQILRAHLSVLGGYEFGTGRRRFCVAFHDTVTAVRWCLRVQTALLEAAWPEALADHPEAALEPGFQGLRSGMGVHRGTPKLWRHPVTGRPGYTGATVQLLQRVTDVAQGGQILLAGPWDDSCQALDLERRDLGLHWLEGLTEPIELTQMLPASLARRRFAQLDTGERERTNLPEDVKPLVGREIEKAALTQLLRDGHRLISVTGPAGVGKTALVRYVARTLVEEWSVRGGGVWFCDLTGARTAEDLEREVSTALGAPHRSDDVGALLAARGRILVLLDTFEQLVGAGSGLLDDWLGKAVQATLLVTSREPLRLRRERVLPLAPLPTADGVALFRERAATDLTDAQSALEELVSRLDGLPLAIELAAARCRVLSPQQIVARLDQRFALLKSGDRDADARHATLREAIDWSWTLLEPAEREALAQCTVFRGGFDLEAAEEVVDLSRYPDAPLTLDVVSALRDKSLLRDRPSVPGELRFDMLESIRAYASERARELPELYERHARAFSRLGQRLQAEWRRDRHGDQLRRLDRERENLLAALHRCRTTHPQLAAELLLVLSELFAHRGPLQEWRRLLDAALAEPKGPLHRRLLLQSATCRRLMGDDAGARTELLELLEGPESDEIRVNALGKLCYTLRRLGDLDAFDARIVDLERAIEEGGEPLPALWDLKAARLQSRGLVDEAILARMHALEAYRAMGDRVGEAETLDLLGLLHTDRGDVEAAISCHREALRIDSEIGREARTAQQLNNLANCYVERGDFAEAAQLYAQAQARHRRDGRAAGVALATANLAVARLHHEELREAEAGLRQGIEALREANWEHPAAFFSAILGSVLADRDASEEAESWFRSAEQSLAGHNDPAGEALVRVCRGHGDLARARAGDRTGLEAAAARLTGALPDNGDLRLAVRRLRRALPGGSIPP